MVDAADPERHVARAHVSCEFRNGTAPADFDISFICAPSYASSCSTIAAR